MPLIIDTYNVLHVVGVLPPDMAGIEVRGLVLLMQGSRYRHERIVLVCDGVGAPGVPAGRVGSVTIRFAGPNRQADDLIAAMIRQSTDPRRLTVVSSDRRVAREAAKRRCKTLSSEEFLRRLVDDAEIPGPRRHHRQTPAGPLSKPQIERWASIFGLDADAPPPAEVQPSEDDLREVLRGVGTAGGGESEATSAQPPTTEDADQVTTPPPDVETDENRKPAPPRTPILPGRLIREAAELVAGFESASEPQRTVTGEDRKEQDQGERDPAGREPDRAPPSELPEDLPMHEGSHPILPPDIIRQAEELLNDLEPDPANPDKPDDECPPE